MAPSPGKPSTDAVVGAVVTGFTVASGLMVVGGFVAPSPTCGGWCMFQFTWWWELIMVVGSLGSAALVYYLASRR